MKKLFNLLMVLGLLATFTSAFATETEEERCGPQVGEGTAVSVPAGGTQSPAPVVEGEDDNSDDA